MNKKKIILIVSLVIIIITILIFINENRENPFVWESKYGIIWIFPLLFLAIALILNYGKNKTLKIVLSTILILVILYCAILSIEMNRICTSTESPIFAWKTKETENKVSYQGLGYTINICTNYLENGAIKSQSTVMYMFNKVIAGVETINVNINEEN